MNKLVPSVVRLISSGQVIHSIQSVIKELIENSLDAGATSIDIKLENFGLDKIEIRDNGCGIPATETAYMGQKHYTSKLRDMQDLSSIMTYGFRGEALSSLCAVSDVSIVTKTQTDNVSTFYELHYDGTIKKSKPSHYGQGTSIIACNLFKSLPVRRQVYKTNKKCKEELKRIEDLIISYAIIKPTVRFCLKHNKSVIWQKCQVADIGSAISVAFGRAVFSEMITINYKGEDPAFSLRGYIPKNYSNDELTGRSNSDRCFIYINQRPVMFKGVLQAIKHHYLACQKGQINKWPIAILDFTIDSKLVDVNVESSKTQVYLSFKDELIASFNDHLDSLAPSEHQCSDPPQKLDLATKAPDVSVSNESSVIKESVSNHCYDQISYDGKSVETPHEVSKVHNAVQAFDINSTSYKNTTNAMECTDDHDGQNNDNATTAKIGDENIVISVQESATTDSKHELPESSKVDTEDLIMEIAEDDGFTGTVDHDNSLNKNESIPICDDHAKTTIQDNNKSEVDDVERVILPENIDLASWSKGKGLEERTLEPVSILVPMRGPENAPDTPLGVDMLSTPDKINDNEPNNKVLASELRNKHDDLIIKETSAKSNSELQQLSGMIQDRWKALTSGELCKSKKSSKGRNLSPFPKRPASRENNKLSEVSSPSVLNFFTPNTTRSTNSLSEESDGEQDETIVYNFELMKANYEKLRKSPLDENTEMIGPIDSTKLWLLRQKNEVLVADPYKIEERFVYEKFMAEHRLPIVVLSRSITLTEGMIGDPLLCSILWNMSNQHNPPDKHSYYQDERLVANGFLIRRDIEIDYPYFEIVSMTRNIYNYGIADLKEILECIANVEGDLSNVCKLSQCRPAKVVSYFRGEARRISSMLKKNLKPSEANDIIAKIKRLPTDCTKSLRGKELFHRVALLKAELTTDSTS